MLKGRHLLSMESVQNVVEPPPSGKEKSTANNFRISNLFFFLTYSQISFEEDTDVKQRYLDAFWKFPNLEQYVVGLEQHEDGGYHIHAFLKYAERVNSRDPRVFDVDGFHPKIIIPTKYRNCARYCAGLTRESRRKPGAIDYLTNIPADTFATNETETYASIINGSSSKSLFLQGVQQRFPRDFVLNLKRLEYAASYLWGEERGEEYTPLFTQFAEPTDLTEWREHYLTLDDVCKLLYTQEH